MAKTIQLTVYIVEEWIKNYATGEFHYTKVLDGQVDKAVYGKLRKIMYEIVHKPNPVCEPVGRKDGFYRPIGDLPQPLDWQSADSRKDSGLILPFGLRDWVWVYPNTITIVAGSKSSGKTGFLYRVVHLNMSRKNVVLLTNMEGGVEQMKDRFDSMKPEIPSPAPFQVFYATDHFHDFMKLSNTLYVIDYITEPEDTGEFYMISGAITKIRKKIQTLGNCEAVIGLQKPFGRDIALGGQQTLRDATLYLALNKNTLKIVDAKVPADPNVNPTNKQWTFIYSEAGTNFLNIVESDGQEQTQW